ncbi:SusC/RagA family TonB-linked outer membrane protein [Flavobacterium johnsoniae]|jgi:TonB-linked SusC/RagA family outer membrane protein|uniref:SusC-like TonB-dependent receptor n=1 Tax=Flavobacterium johnsoniae (strain ATCC 17061 / DSM 2064 / JCM 8514 / BCRC 14874 / CCUG 350202 / NBRC 14942 / NCIMB 11054 / UW101) TaxID=376686 RepID=A5FBC3_FLAJ1|nr:SusC/RagA family TonB-linked outer membrane protein [Flavobacterium johnsoniae]ABQ07499.1 SusC-like TonB-dependent receptor [Flavobacterium johnsoniae UW101]OXE99401.1 SusC/RagA family TonB-linked outer membrane protein [Flavobacterium johnsoniae UW101]WQG80662.1 SusC/RagA family TonB-linked outer membrane protein [Flavobacterium johnsoniae UW101]SHL11079.1 TonB-linked outer membrane protein, SusC/RagA family [Flavobacterium johnsoniae]
MKKILNRYTWLCILLISIGINAQETKPLIQSKLVGTVVDAVTKDPVIGASVVIKGTTHGVQTDFDGKFFFQTGQKFPYTVIVSYLGYKKAEVVVNDNPVVIELTEEQNQLSEVVVTALGISKEKKSLGYTTQALKNKDIADTKETNFLNSLSGKLAGVRITNSQGDMGSSRIIIRGETSIAGNNQPLFVVDGVPVDNSQLGSVGGATRDFKNAIADLNPNDIETLTVLKGPNAAALYGSRAAHGVVLITTKSGKSQKGLGITFSSGITISQVATLPSFQNSYGQGSNGRFSFVDGKGGGVNDGVDESWGPRLDGRLIPQFYSNGEAVPFVAHPNNVKDFFNTGVTYDNSISVARSDEKSDFRLGVNNQKQLGTVPNSEVNKTNFTINTNYQISKGIRVGATANYITTNAPALPGGPSGNRAAGVMLQFLWFGRQVDINQLRNNRDVNWNNSYYSNPYWNAYYNTTSQQRNRIIGDVHLDAKLAEGLNFKFRTGVDYYNDRRKYTIKYGTNGTPFGSYAEDAYTVNEQNTEGIFTYTKKLNDDFTVDALAGFNIRNHSDANNYQKAPRLAVPDLYTLTNSRDPLTSSNTLSRLRVYSAYASAQFGYKNYAYLNLTARNDWSSTLPSSNRSYFYPSINGSLILSEALKLKSNTLDFLKLRGGWSEVGNDADPYQLSTVYNFQTAFDGNPIQTSSQKKLNENLKPETTRSTEVGLEASFFKNRLHFDFAYYNTNSFDQILEIKTTASSGYNSQLINAGKVNNNGIEIQLDGTPVQTENFKWNIGANYSRNRSKVEILDYAKQIQNYTIGSSGGVDVLASVGQAYGALYGTAYLRDASGNIVVGANGLPKADPTKRVLGHYTPDYLAGVTNTLTYKNLELSFLVDASVGGEIFSGTNRTGTYTGVLASTLPGRGAENGGLSYYLNGTTKTLVNGAAPGGAAVYDDGMVFNGVYDNGTPNTTIISAQEYYKASYNISEAYIYSSTFVKMREIKLAYNFNKSFAKKLGLEGASITAVGRNLFFIYKDAPNIDPETAFNTGNAQGLESLALPTTRNFSLNVNLKF